MAELRREGLDVRPLQIDVADDVSVAAAAETLANDTDRLDALVNNAGISAGRGPPSEETVASVRSLYEVNVFGAIRATHALLPLLRASKAPRIVMISSSLGSLAWASDFGAPNAQVNLLGYNSSKPALNAVTVAFAKGARPAGLQGQCRLSGLHRHRPEPASGTPHAPRGGGHRRAFGHPAGRRAERRLLRRRRRGDLVSGPNGVAWRLPVERLAPGSRAHVGISAAARSLQTARLPVPSFLVNAATIICWRSPR